MVWAARRLSVAKTAIKQPGRTHLAVPDFGSGASTSSATYARTGLLALNANKPVRAYVAELVDAPDPKSGTARCVRPGCLMAVFATLSRRAAHTMRQCCTLILQHQFRRQHHHRDADQRI